ncbi:MAG: hypothetical protein AAFX54_17085 [Pseudomonadota bacterium]
MFHGKFRVRIAAIAATGAGVVLTAAMAQVALPEAVETAPLATDAFSTGVLDRSNGALPPTLWQGSDSQTLEYLLAHMPSRPSAPSLGETLKRVLLSPGPGPQGAAASLGGKKLLALARAGFAEEARTVSSLSTASRGDPWTGQADAVADLLSGEIAAACRRNANLTSGRDELFWVRLRALCYVEAGETDAADLTLGILRDQGALDASDLQFLTAALTGAAPKSPTAAQNALQYAIARRLELPFSPGLLNEADAGVLVAVAKDASLDAATRIAASERAIAMGVMGHAMLSGLLQSVEFDVAEISNAATTARERAADPLSDALLYQSIGEMVAPEFLRDKAQRIAIALELADSFHRAYALSLLYADEIAALEGTIVTAEEASRFALARMAVGDSVGAGQWLAAMVGSNGGVTALPEAQAMAFIEHVNLLAVLDPQTAAQIARIAGISILGDDTASAHSTGHGDDVTTAMIIETAFDAAINNKRGQAGLAALAASAGAAQGGEIESVVISQSLRAAGLAQMQRRFAFENAWASKFKDASGAAATTTVAADGQSGLMPRLKPPLGQ